MHIETELNEYRNWIEWILKLNWTNIEIELNGSENWIKWIRIELNDYKN